LRPPPSPTKIKERKKKENWRKQYTAVVMVLEIADIVVTFFKARMEPEAVRKDSQSSIGSAEGSEMWERVGQEREEPEVVKEEARRESEEEMEKVKEEESVFVPGSSSDDLGIKIDMEAPEPFSLRNAGGRKSGAGSSGFSAGRRSYNSKSSSHTLPSLSPWPSGVSGRVPASSSSSSSPVQIEAMMVQFPISAESAAMMERKSPLNIRDFTNLLGGWVSLE